MAQILSWWEQEQWFAPAEVAIVGGGLLGLWICYALQEMNPDVKVTIVERSAVPNGASTRNAGFACFGSPSELRADAMKNGVESMQEIAWMRYRGISKMRRVLGDQKMGFEPCGGFECYSKADANFQSSVEEVNEWLAPVFEERQIFSVAETQQIADMGFKGFEAMTINPLEGSIHSGKTVQSLSQLVQQRGATLLFGAGVLRWEASSGGWCLHTTRGRLSAQKMVIATNAWLPELVQDFNVVPARGQVLLTQPIPGLGMKGTFHFDEGFYYWRHVGNRVLLGGARNSAMEEEATLEMATTQKIQTNLQQFLCRHLPAYFDFANVEKLIEYSWGGIMAMSPDKQPILQQLQPHAWAAMCCNGMGVAMAPVFAEKVAMAIAAS